MYLGMYTFVEIQQQQTNQIKKKKIMCKCACSDLLCRFFGITWFLAHNELEYFGHCSYNKYYLFATYFSQHFIDSGGDNVHSSSMFFFQILQCVFCFWLVTENEIIEIIPNQLTNSEISIFYWLWHRRKQIRFNEKNKIDFEK